MKTLRNAAWDIIKRFFVAAACTIGVFVVFGFILERLEIVVTSQMIKSMGSGAILFTAVVGTPFHEGAHWIGCKIFGFTVTDVELLRPVAYKQDGILGYVSYQMNPDSLWHQLGSVITGMAPMIFGSVFMILMIRFLTPDVFEVTKKSIENRPKHKIPIVSIWWAAFSGFWTGIFRLRKWGIVRGVICIYFVISIAMHMTLSGQDIVSASKGFMLLGILYLIYAIVTAAIGTEYIKPSLKVAGFISALLSIGLIADIIMLLIFIIL